MHQEQRDRTQAILRERGLERALFAHPGNITWLTGLPAPWRAGADLYAGGPSLIWYEGGAFTLIAMDREAAAAETFGQQRGCQVVGYQGYSYTEQPAGPDLLAAALKEVAGGTGNSAIGLETRHLPLFLVHALQEAVGSDKPLTPIDGWLDGPRMLKTAGEIAAMRRNYELITVAQNAAKEAVQPGKLELDVWYAIHMALQQTAGQTMPLGNDCTVGRRGGGPPHPVEILETDSFVVDLSTILEGYWSDSCVTYYATVPSPKQVKMHRTAAEALDLAISLARPGAVAREIDHQVRGFITNAGFPVYPHHTGHGIGVMGHEAPRIVPHSDEVLQAGMVIMLEPGIYYPGETGVRLEHAVLVTEDGPEVLSTYDLNTP